MSTAIALANVQLPAYLTEMGGSSVLDNAVSGIKSGNSNPRISIKGSRFRIVEDGVEQTLNVLTLSSVIVGANSALSRQYYEGAYDPDNAGGPACFSDDGVSPDITAEQPQSDRCATCPKSVWGSKISPQGKEIKACSDLKRLAVVSSDDLDGSIYELTVTPSALTDFNKYARDLKVRKIPVEACKTILGFDANASYPKLTFSFGGFLDRDEAMKARAIAIGDEVKEVVRQKVIPVVQQIAAPVATPAPVAAAPAAQPTPAAAPKKAAKGFGGTAEAAPAAAPKKAAKGFGAPAEAPVGAPVEKELNPAPVAAAPAADLSDFEAELAEFAATGAADDAE